MSRQGKPTGWSLALKWSALAVLVTAAVLAAGIGLWLNTAMPLAAPRVELSIEPGTSPREVAQAWVKAGVQAPTWALYQWFRLSGQAKRIRAGSYELEHGITPRGLLAKMVQGDEAFERLRLIEGWTWAQCRAELARSPKMRQTGATLDDAELMAAIGLPGVPPEGRFFPDTYVYSRGVSDLTVLRRAAQAMERRLATVWAERAADLPLRNEAEALTLASIIEKETGQRDERGLVAGVFINRLRLGMPLQTDPSVVYGLGKSFSGRLQTRDLRADTPFNTYTRNGLPPTPIAMPGLAALRAAVKPEPTKALYFVARGDGSSVFSNDLATHNRAVNQYQRNVNSGSKQ